MKTIYQTDLHKISINNHEEIDIRDYLIQKLNNYRKIVENSGVLFNDFIIHTNPDSITKIASTVLAFQAGLVTSVNWKTRNGWIKDADMEIILGIAATMTQHIQNCFNTEQIIEEDIRSKTEEELKNYSVEHSWLEFGGPKILSGD